MESTDLIIVLMSIVGCCMGLHVASDEDMVLEPIRKLLEDKAEGSKSLTFLFKPVLLCVCCMPSIYGTIIYWAYILYASIEITWWVFFVWPIIILTSSFLNCFIGWSLEFVKNSAKFMAALVEKEDEQDIK